MDSLPHDPVSMMDEMGASLHELFEVLVRAGFTEWQACVVVGVFVTTTNAASR